MVALEASRLGHPARVIRVDIAKNPPSRPLSTRASLTFAAEALGVESVLVEAPVHFGDEPLFSETCFLEDATRSSVVGVRERPDEVNPELISRERQAKLCQLRGVAVTPCSRSESVADFDAPTGIKRIVIKPAKADNLSVRLRAHGPRAIPDFPSLAFVAGNVPAAISESFQLQGVPHRFPVAQKIEQVRRLNEPRDGKQ
jgi:hypothetical protein